MAMITAEKFLLTYSIFLFFLVLMISMGFQYFGGNIGNLTVPTLPTDTSQLNLITYLIFVFDNILFFFTLMSVDFGIFWIGLLILSPAFLTLLYMLLKLIRGGG